MKNKENHNKYISSGCGSIIQFLELNFKKGNDNQKGVFYLNLTLKHTVGLGGLN